jgi:hypothetical protein
MYAVKAKIAAITNKVIANPPEMTLKKYKATTITATVILRVASNFPTFGFIVLVFAKLSIGDKVFEICFKNSVILFEVIHFTSKIFMVESLFSV